MQEAFGTRRRFGARKIAIHARPRARPLQTPVERTHDAIAVAGGETRFPRVHPAFVEVVCHIKNIAEVIFWICNIPVSPRKTYHRGRESAEVRLGFDSGPRRAWMDEDLGA